MSTFLAACRGESTAHTPIWLMRQAGRYQPEYRAIREKLSFIELCKASETAAEVTVMAVEQLGVDAAIIFADILLVLEPLGVGFEFAKDHGPRILEPVRSSEAVDAVAEQIDPAESLGYVMEAIRQTRKGLPSGIPLIGFAGAPFTLASYVIEGGGSKNYFEAKKMMYGDEGAWNVLMTKITDATIRYLKEQVKAGAQALQLFDSWVGCLGPYEYARYVAPHMRKLFSAIDGLEQDGVPVPTIHFGTGNTAILPQMKEAGGSVLGLDWRVDLGATWQALGQDTAIQGNMDPGALLAPRQRMFEAAQAVLDSAAGQPGHIFNLGHGIMPQAEVDQVKALVDYVHESSAR